MRKCCSLSTTHQVKTTRTSITRRPILLHGAAAVSTIRHILESSESRLIIEQRRKLWFSGKKHVSVLFTKREYICQVQCSRSGLRARDCFRSLLSSRQVAL